MVLQWGFLENGLIEHFNSLPVAQTTTYIITCFPQSVQVVQEKFSDYESLAAAEPPKPVIPPELRSSYLTAEENQRIWAWLHHGETMSHFDYFLSVCG